LAVRTGKTARTTGEETMVQKTVKNVVVAALLGAIIIIMGSCQQGMATDETPGEDQQAATEEFQDIDIILNEESGNWELPTVRVRRTHRIRFNAGDRMVWMLFPGDFDYVRGKGSFCKTANLLAVTVVPNGYAVIEVPEYFPNPDREQTIRYSVMFMERGGEKWGDWKYAHGPNTPPGMIIPPGGP
jgi:hypothetical protein